MFGNGRVGGIDYYKSLTNLGDSLSNQQGAVNYWQKLADYCSKMSADQQSFVEKNPKVQVTRAKMMDAFLLYLFERHKDEFIQLDGFRQLCDDYIDTVINTSNDYSAQITQAISENDSLKNRVAELERKLNEQSNSN